ncbi:hypothetical protein HGA91_03095 [candidate division WWE3 bacterium]|nr:hypothetical protein [candidate division WWE3 bacterium]
MDIRLAYLGIALLAMLCACGEDPRVRDQRLFDEWCQQQKAPVVKIEVRDMMEQSAQLVTTVPDGLTGTVSFGPVNTEIWATPPFSVTGSFSQVMNLTNIPDGHYWAFLEVTKEYFAPEGKFQYDWGACRQTGRATADLIVDRAPPKAEITAKLLDQSSFELVITAFDLSGIKSIALTGVDYQIAPNQLLVLGPVTFPISYTKVYDRNIVITMTDNRGHNWSGFALVPLQPNRWELRSVSPWHLWGFSREEGNLIGVAPYSKEAPTMPLWGYGWGREWRQIDQNRETGKRASTNPIYYVVIGALLAVLVSLVIVRRYALHVHNRLVRINEQREPWRQKMGEMREAIAQRQWSSARQLYHELLADWQVMATEEDNSWFDQVRTQMSQGLINDDKHGQRAARAIIQGDWTNAFRAIQAMPADWAGRFNRNDLLEEIALTALRDSLWAVAYRAMNALPAEWTHGEFTRQAALERIAGQWAEQRIVEWHSRCYDFASLAKDESPDAVLTLFSALRDKLSYYHVLGFTSEEEAKPDEISITEIGRRWSLLMAFFAPEQTQDGVNEDQIARARLYFNLDREVPDSVVAAMILREPWPTIELAYALLKDQERKLEYDEVLMHARTPRAATTQATA